jgi:sortase A
VCGIALFVVKVQAFATHRTASQFGTVTASAGIPPLANLASATVVKKEDAATDVMGRLEIRSIGLSVPIVYGFNPEDLRRGVGHVHGTAMPGGLGNMALAGHRDTFFRPLRNIRQGMTVSVFTPDGRYDYVVDSTTIVDPNQVSVLAIHDIPEMTLITCYPFDFIGSAPHRFITRAHLKSIEPVGN